jgi:hypothetical protein
MKVSARAVVIEAAMLAVIVLAIEVTGRHASRAPGLLGLDTGTRRDPRAAIFVQHGCAECHAIAALGVKAATDAPI